MTKKETFFQSWAALFCVVNRPTERERTERLIKTRLREIMMQKDLENVTSKEVNICPL